MKMKQFAPRSSAEPAEPVLNMDNIQGIAVPGFTKPHQTLIGIKIPDGLEEKFKELLRHNFPPIATAAQVLADRRAFREKRMTEKAHKYARPSAEGAVFVAISLGYSGLTRLVPSAAYTNSPAFKLGLPARSSLLGDPIDPSAEGYPANWVVGTPGSELD